MTRPFRFEPLLDWAEQRKQQQARELAALSHEEQDARALLEALEDLDDVQSVYANFDIPESVMAELG